ncbi:MAG: hypothetical protein KBC53_09315 [Nitrosomonas sp.]|nr:hypothetical protein [Nitrosomonas sp.]
METIIALARKIALCLYGNPTKEVVIREIDFNELHAQMLASESSRFSKKEFKDALRYLKGKGYIIEEAASYSLTSEGIDFVLDSQVNYASLGVQYQRQGNRLNASNVILTVVFIAVTIMIAVAARNQSALPTQSGASLSQSSLSSTLSSQPVVIQPSPVVPTSAPSSNLPTRPAAFISDPSDFIVAYYAAYSNKDVNTAWSMISDQAHARDHQSLKEYQDRIDDYESVTTQNAQTLPGNPTTVQVIITYHYHDGSLRSFLSTFTLVPNESTGWLIDSVSSTSW